MFLTALALIMLQTEATALDDLEVHQTPPYMIKKLREDSVMSCSHSIRDYDVILWYKHDRVGMVLMGYLNNNQHMLEDDFKEKVDIRGNGRESSNLTIKNLSLSDSAVYFCAASTVLQIVPKVVTKHAMLISVCQVMGVRFQQPQHKIVHVASTVVFKCSHDRNEEIILWYRQKKGRQPIEVVGLSRMGNRPFYQQRDPRIVIKREDKKTGFLNISSVRVSDTVVACNLKQNTKQQRFLLATFWNIWCKVHAYCATRASESSFDSGTMLTVLEPSRVPNPPTVTLFKPSPKECTYNKKTQEKTLVCAITGFFPDHVQVFWQVNGHNVTKGVATDTGALMDGAFYKMTSRLQVAADLWYKPNTAFTCTVSFFDGKNTTLHSKEEYGIEGQTDKMTRVGYLRLVQSAKLSYCVLLVKSTVFTIFVGFLLWKRQGLSSKLIPT
ncbi:M1-specific T cell receptor beta chain-like [Corythoichthys intestinalis]|uniref:M1-specific T cell receptor beta chain-like n=1 Tax=Corythoichthys intestinalis TaxID=161448 RepID=UPI0025A4DB80|nr:M1-specific T cell receptor beta chain-like [Corythoichthys intestinalis]